MRGGGSRAGAGRRAARRSGRIAPSIVALVAALLDGAVAVAGDEEATTAARGERLFRLHCASCHGEDARGAGPVATYLTVRPADLTAIAASSGGEFPAGRVHETIDGRLSVPTHGAREMPVWGLTFRDPGRDDDQEADVEARIRDLVRYLESIQQPPAEAGEGAGEGEEGAGESAAAQSKASTS